MPRFGCLSDSRLWCDFAEGFFQSWKVSLEKTEGFLRIPKMRKASSKRVLALYVPRSPKNNAALLPDLPEFDSITSANTEDLKRKGLNANAEGLNSRQRHEGFL